MGLGVDWVIGRILGSWCVLCLSPAWVVGGLAGCGGKDRYSIVKVMVRVRVSEMVKVIAEIMVGVVCENSW